MPAGCGPGGFIAARLTRTLATTTRDPIGGFVLTQQAVTALVSNSAGSNSGAHSIGVVVNPAFEMAEERLNENDWDKGHVATEWGKYMQQLKARFEALHGEDLLTAWQRVAGSAQFANAVGMTHLWTAILVVTDKTGKRHEFPLVNSVDVSALLAHCSPSPFGDLRTLKSRMDPAVRTAMELKHKDVAGPGEAYFELECRAKEREEYNEPVPLGQAVTRAAAWLAAGVPGRTAVAVPQKLNIYGPGGHFKRHVDTPVGDRPAMLGTALVALPSNFKGGELVVQPPNAAGSATASASSSSSNSSSAVTWEAKERYAPPMIAFFGDCPHEVKPVTAGHRVTLSFAVFAEGGGEGSSNAPAAVGPRDARDTARTESIEAFVAQVQESLKARKPIGLILTHGYTLTSLDETKPNLKAADAMVWSALRAADLGGAIVHLRPVVYTRYEKRFSYEGAPVDTLYKLSSSVYSFTREEMKALRDGKSMPKPTVTALAHAGNSAESSRRRGDAASTGSYPSGQQRRSLPLEDISFFTLKTPEVRLRDFRQDAVEWSGNNAEPGIDDQTYFSGAIIVLPA